MLLHSRHFTMKFQNLITFWGAVRAVIFIPVSLFFSVLNAQTTVETSVLLKEIKEASYYDSARLFQKGNELMKATHDAAAIAEMYLYYGNYYYYKQKKDSAAIYFQRAASEAVKGKSPHIETLAHIRLIYTEYDKGRRFWAESRLYELLDTVKLASDFRNTAEILNLLAIIEDEKGNTKKAAEMYYQGLGIAESNNLHYYTAVFRNNLGLIKFYAGEIEEAEKDFSEGLIKATIDNSNRVASHLKMNLCLCYVHLKKQDDLYRLFAEVIDYSKKNNLPLEMASNYLNLGSALMNEGSIKEAECYIDSAITTAKIYNLDNVLTRAYFGKAEVFLINNRIKEAEHYISLAEQRVIQQNNLRDKVILLSYRIKAAEKNGNYKQALELYKEYNTLNDSLNNQMNTKIIEELQFDFRVQQKETELEKQQAKIAMLELQNQKEQMWKWLIAASALFLVLGIVAILYNRYLRKIKEKQEAFSKMLIDNTEEERKRISMDLHDDIGQGLSIVKSKIIKMGAGAESDIEEDLSKLIEQTREISRNLYPSNIEKIGLKRAVASLLEQLQSLKGLECSYEIEDSVLELPIRTQTHLFRIIQECASNTLKHSGASGLKITINEKNHEYTVTYNDNGIGLKNKKTGPGIGLLSIRERARMIGGDIEIDEKPERGFKLILKFRNKPVVS